MYTYLLVWWGLHQPKRFSSSSIQSIHICVFGENSWEDLGSLLAVQLSVNCTIHKRPFFYPYFWAWGFHFDPRDREHTHMCSTYMFMKMQKCWVMGINNDIPQVPKQCAFFSWKNAEESHFASVWVVADFLHFIDLSVRQRAKCCGLPINAL